ncbi:unnamed protein product [Chondrus crispus]|uniref:Uncharacterized protein n=1 Tax=Chondrus crispus TaxID=2769 RepID=R7QHB9_CHOCR|nr:unnamed protein product [Chondrus crispus]CDF37148.1 unnamed protein product [Chondrus crispus]|eukprot:XP_005716967.1 unnamed protein product [Chondrus crispus]
MSICLCEGGCLWYAGRYSKLAQQYRCARDGSVSLRNVRSRICWLDEKSEDYMLQSTTSPWELRHACCGGSPSARASSKRNGSRCVEPPAELRF